ncbi:MAG TPA: peptidase S41, partial [Myxococcales bacterium]|nr:peptidase S41 [Myxococcales bacterium]
RRAWIVGESIPTTIAESRWQGVGQAGIAFRTMELSNNNTLWPDTIQADHPMSHLETLTKKLSEKTELPALLTGIPQRPRIKPHHYFQKFHTQLLSKASLQAALLIAHGALRAFFPYFSTVGDRIDERLEETLKTATSTTLDDVTARNILRRFGESIKDGHCFVNYRGRSSAKGFMLVELDKLNGKPVIRRTAHTELKVGDTILSINHVSAEKWFTEEYKRTSAATPGYQFDMAARELNRMFGPVVLKLQSVDGDTRTVTVQPQPYEAYSKFAQKPFRPAGFLKDLHAEDVMYVDLDNKAIDQTDFNAVIQMMQNAKSLVLDMRGYPNRTSWQLLQHIATNPLPSPLFSTPEWKGPSDLRRSESSYDLQALTPVFKGPVAFLIGPRSVSSAEHVSTMLKQINRVTFVGRTTAGTNGNITGLVLPGLFTFTFTGMEILYRDRKPFHGIGIVPDIEVSPTPQDLAQGKDPVLQKAIEFLKKP